MSGAEKMTAENASLPSFSLRCELRNLTGISFCKSIVVPVHSTESAVKLAKDLFEDEYKDALVNFRDRFIGDIRKKMFVPYMDNS